MKVASALPPRLLSDEESAAYLGVSKSYVRALIDRGVLKRVDLPTINGPPGSARLLRLDVRQLDAFVDSLART
jgi:hypothetical protein